MNLGAGGEGGPNEHELQLCCERLDGAGAVSVLVSVTGDLDLATVPCVERELTRAAKAHDVVILDLRSVTFLDSTALNMVLRNTARLRAERRRLVLLIADGPVPRLLNLTGVNGELDTLHLSPEDDAGELVRWLAGALGA